MKFRFTHHANFRLFLERDISADDIKTVVREPESVLYLPNGSVKCLKKVEKGILTVVYAKKKNLYVIITAYFKQII